MAGKKMGAPIKKIDWKEFDKLGRIQCTLSEIAIFFGVSEDTVERRVQEKFGITFAEHIETRRKQGFTSLRRKQWQNALEKNSTSMQIWLDKRYMGGNDIDKPQVPNVIVEKIVVQIEDVPERGAKERASVKASTGSSDDSKE